MRASVFGWLAAIAVAGQGLFAQPLRSAVVGQEPTLVVPAQEPVSDRGNASVARPSIDLTGAELLGDASAPLVMVEFSNPSCSFSADYARHTFPQIRDRYVAGGLVRYAVLDSPGETDLLAASAAAAAHCAGEQGQFWLMRDRLFGHQGNLADDQLPIHARAIRLNVVRFRQCLRSDTSTTRVSAGIAEGKKAGVTGTPSFVLGTADAQGHVRVLTTLEGALPFDDFRAAIDTLLAASAPAEAAK